MPVQRIDVVTIFPGYFVSPLGEALLGKAVDRDLLEIHLVDMRRFSEDLHHKVDDEAFGGGPGMVLAAPPIVTALEALSNEPETPAPWVVFLSPRGARFDAAKARELAERPRLVFVCGRYEGIDERVRELGFIDEEISVGDFVLSGGEAAALVVIEAVSRFVPGVVGDQESVREDSFEGGLLDFPHYTRPRVFRDLPVPDVLVSGHHERIRQWRLRKRLEETARCRPDLFWRYQPAKDEEDVYRVVAERIGNP